MSEEKKEFKVLVMDGDNAQSVAALLSSKGINCEIINAEPVVEPEFPNLDHILTRNIDNSDNHCWWQRFDKKKKNK